jgi:uncharacterized membrane protein required for colicin V production
MFSMWYDVYLIVHVVLGILIGAWAGFSRQFAEISSIILGFFIGLPLAARIAANLQASGIAVHLLIFVGCYAGIALVCALFGKGLRRRLKAANLTCYDRHMGAMLGALQGLVIAAIGTLLIVNLHEESQKTVQSRPSVRVVTRTIEGIREVLPEGIDTMIAPYVRRIGEVSTGS